MDEEAKYQTPEEGYRVAKRYILNNALRRNQRSLDLSRYNLLEVPPEIGQLLVLEVLVLSKNQLSRLPVEIAKLTSLREIYLDNNHFSEFPLALSELPNLTLLSLADNILTDIPKQISQIQNLSVLDLSSNGLGQIPEAISSLKHLKSLSLRNNHIEEIPDFIASITSLEYLGLTENQIRFLSDEFSDARSITTLDLASNEIRELPESFSNLSNLNSLWLDENEFREFPDVLLSMVGLSSLSLSANRIKKIPPTINNLRNLLYFSLKGVGIEVLPPEIGLLKQLRNFDLSNNMLLTLPETFRFLQQLVLLDISNNIIDEFPHVITSLPSLSDLNISNNLVRRLPSSIGNLRRLSRFSMVGNSIDSLPPEIGNLSRLEQIFASRNRITEIPASFGELSRLWSLSLRDNELINLPTNLGQLKFSENRTLEEFGLHLGNNPLSMPYPKLIKHDQPNATDYVLSWLRGNLTLQEIDDLDPPQFDFESGGDFPDIPNQSSGPHFELSEYNVINFAPPEAIDAEGNNIARLKKLHPALKELASDLVRSLSVGNVPQGPLRDRAVAYQDLIDCEIESVDFALLYVEGVRLANAERASSNDADLPPLPAPVRELVDSLLQLHGTFVLSTREGVENIGLEERYKTSPAEQESYRQAALEFALELQNRPNIINPAAARFVQDVSNEIGNGRIPERSGVVATATLKNVAIALSAVATLASLAIAAASTGSTTTAVGATATTWLGYEGLKKSKAYLASTSLLARNIDRISEIELRQNLKDGWGKLHQQLNFIERLEPKLRNMADIREELRWIREFYEWLHSRK